MSAGLISFKDQAMVWFQRLHALFGVNAVEKVNKSSTESDCKSNAELVNVASERKED